MTSIIKIAALALLPLLLGWHYSQAAETTIIALSCDGTVVDSRTPTLKDPVRKLGLVANLAERTVSFSGYVVKMDSVDAADISFSGQNHAQFAGQPGTTITVMGDIDRVTGHLSATTMSTVSTFTYDLLCKPATRLF